MWASRLGLLGATVGVLLGAAGTSHASAATSPGPALSGVYSGACARQADEQFATQRGRALGVVLDGLDSSNWNYLQSPSWWTQCWSGAPYRVSYAVPLLIDPSDTLEQGATGSYNAHFRTLAQNLVAAGEGNASLRLGWEFNGGWYKWTASNDPAAFAAYWRQIVTTMRAVPGADFTFVWNVANGPQAMDATAAWPGDDVVDQVGVDLYDITWAADTYPYPANDSTADVASRQQNAWNALYSGPQGLASWTAFAAAHGKPVALPEWGLVTRSDGQGGGDDPAFINHVRDYVSSNNVVTEIYFDVVADLGDHRLSSAPLSQAAYLADFGTAASLAPVTTAPVTTAPVTTAPVTTAPVTTAPVTTAPVTTAPVTTAPVTTAPVTTAPVTTAPVTTAPVTTAPVTTAPVTTAPVSSVVAPAATAPAVALTPAVAEAASVAATTAPAVALTPAVAAAAPVAATTTAPAGKTVATKVPSKVVTRKAHALTRAELARRHRFAQAALRRKALLAAHLHTAHAA